jgi:hypothetical protein
VEKQRLRRDPAKACKVLTGEESINTALPTKSQCAGISENPLKFKVQLYGIKKKLKKPMLCF